MGFMQHEMRTVNFEGEPVSLVSVIDITDKIMYQKRIDELSENVHCGLARSCYFR